MLTTCFANTKQRYVDAYAGEQEQNFRNVLETIEEALIATIQESLQIADQGKKMRSEAVAQLEQCETELRNPPVSTHAKSTG